MVRGSLDSDSVSLWSFSSLVSRYGGLRAWSQPRPRVLRGLEWVRGQDAQGLYKETTGPQYSKSFVTSVLISPSTFPASPPGLCPKSSSFPLAGFLRCFLLLIMKPDGLEVTRILLRRGIPMVLLSRSFGHRQLGPLRKGMVSQSSLFRSR